MITLKERNETIRIQKAKIREGSQRTGVACDRCGGELLRLLPDDSQSFWHGPPAIMLETERVYCVNPKCRFQGLMEIL